MNEHHRANARILTGARARNALAGAGRIAGAWAAVARARNGRILYTRAWANIVVDQGLDELLAAALGGATPASAWYVGLTSGSPNIARGDTLASHEGWAEIDAYSEGARVVWTPGAVSGAAIANTKSTFTVNANSTTIGGAFLSSAASGTNGKMYAAGAFAGGDITLSSGSTLDITAEFTAAAA
jgi:hypothetical protein